MEISENIKEAGYGKRILAYLIDSAIVIIAGGIVLGLVTSTFMMDAIGGTKAKQNYLNFEAASGLYEMTTDSDGNYEDGAYYTDFSSDTPTSSSASTASDAMVHAPLLEAFSKAKPLNGTTQTQPAYAEYMDLLWNYYTVFLPTGLASSADYDSRVAVMADSAGTAFTSVDDYYSYFEKDILGLPSPSLYDESPSGSESASTLYDQSEYYRYALSADKQSVDITAEPVLQENDQTVLETGNSTQISTLLGTLETYFYDSSASSGLYIDAINDFEGTGATSSQTYYYDNYQQYGLATYACAWAAFFPFQLAFFFLIPLFMPDGETLGKKICGLAVIGIDDVAMKPWQKIVRQLLTTFLGLVLIMPYIGYFSFMIYIIFALIDYMMIMLSKKHQSIHDKLAKTIVVDAKGSKWYASAAEKEANEASPEGGSAVSPEGEPNAGRLGSEEAILDLTTLNKNREEAKNLKSFDEFEKTKDTEFEAKEVSSQPKVNLTKEDGSSSENGLSKPSPAKTEVPPDESGFTDGTKTGK
jgi:uncharacterized RDD family membrane protein YckC